jgi:tyrosine-protein kinase Etk/Wzc
MGHIQTFDDFISLLIRRRSLIIAVTILGVALSVFVARTRPKTYEAYAAIQIQPPRVTDATAAAEDAASGSVQILQTIEQQLTTRESLLAMIARHGLYADLPALTDEEKIGLLRASVSFQQIASAATPTYGAPTRASALIITARLGDPEQAARVANDFAQGFLDQSSVGQADRARANYVFFQQDEARLRNAIAALEDQIATYKNAHANALPTFADARREELVSLDSDLRDLDQTLIALDSEKVGIAALETLRATDQRRLAEIAASMAQLAAQRTALIARKTEIEAAIAQTPEVDRTLRGFERDLQQLQGQYDVANRRLAEAETDVRLADQQQDERFALLERAITPEFATGRGARRLAFVGAIASVLAALALAFLLDLLKPVVRTEAQMMRELDLRPVVSIPEVPLRQAVQGVAGSEAQSLSRLAVYASLAILALLVIAVSVV